MFLVSVLVLGILVFVHELGHFLVAKYYKVGVLEFAIGFGPTLWKRQYGDTVYSLRAIPLGGFVRMVGDTPEHMIGSIDENELSETERRLLKDHSVWFIKKGLFARAMVVFAGPLFNLIFAWFVAVGAIYTYGIGEPIKDPIVGEVVPDFPAEKAGIQKGDKIVSINGKTVAEWKEVRDFVKDAGLGEIKVVIERQVDGQPSQLEILLKSKETGADVEYVTTGEEGKKSFMIGLVQADKRIDASFPEALLYGGLHVGNATIMNFRSISGLVRGIISPSNLGGPVMIFREAARTAKKGLEPLLNFMIFLSVSLAVLNLLPIPVLDGGHLTFFLVEAIFRRPVSFKVQEYATRVGMAFLFALMLYALRNDIQRLF